MRNDWYTTSLMTVIAVSLAVIALRGMNVIPDAGAQSEEIQKIALCDLAGRCVEVKNRRLGITSLQLNQFLQQ